VAVSGSALTDTFRVVDLTGVLVNAVLGGAIARAEKLDPIGLVALAVLSGLGGGLIRDTLLQHGTPVALTDYAYLVTALAGAQLAILFRLESRLWRSTYQILDALAVGCWAVAGAEKTLAVGLAWLPALLLGTITAVGGGALRDVALRRVPAIFGGNTLYATCALAASGVMVVSHFDNQPTVGMPIAALAGTGLCLVARWRRWVLPAADAWSPAEVMDTARRRKSRPSGRW
jgi:uncharacterized membrane protein YeiH